MPLETPPEAQILGERRSWWSLRSSSGQPLYWLHQLFHMWSSVELKVSRKIDDIISMSHTYVERLSSITLNGRDVAMPFSVPADPDTVFDIRLDVSLPGLAEGGEVYLLLVDMSGIGTVYTDGMKNQAIDPGGHRYVVLKERPHGICVKPHPHPSLEATCGGLP